MSPREVGHCLGAEENALARRATKRLRNTDTTKRRRIRARSRTCVHCRRGREVAACALTFDMSGFRRPEAGGSPLDGGVGRHGDSVGGTLRGHDALDFSILKRQLNKACAIVCAVPVLVWPGHLGDVRVDGGMVGRDRRRSKCRRQRCPRYAKPEARDKRKRLESTWQRRTAL